MSKSFRYCIKCKDEESHHFGEEDKKWFCEVCNNILDERRVRHIEAKLDKEHEIDQLLNERGEIDKELKKLGVEFK